MRFFRNTAGRGAAKAPSSARPFLEELEARLAPYAATGNAWPEPQLITISFVPDGTLMTSGPNGNVYSDLFAKFNAKWSTQAWENAILSAAQTWAQYANVNFAVVPDNGTPEGQGNYQQGDPGMGDIRISGYNIGSSYLGMTYLPPPSNNYSAAGDLTFNDTQAFNLGRTYDLTSVALHEFGHALGLDHSTVSTANVMYPTYNGLKKGLTADDIAGIQSVYGARQPDANNLLIPNNSFATATDLSAQFLLGPTAQSNANDLTAVGATQYYTFTAPLTGPSNFTVYVQSAGLSLLRPQVTVYAADQLTVLGSASGAGSNNGANLAVQVNGVVPGQQYSIAVTGADATAFATGNYNLTVSLGNSSMPAVTSPVSPLLNGAVLQAGGGLALTAVQGATPDFLTIDPNFTDGSSGGQAASDPVTGFVGLAYRDLLGRPADPLGLVVGASVYTQAEVNAVQMILSNPQLSAYAQALLQQPGGAQAIQNYLSACGEAAVVQDILWGPEYQARGANTTGVLDQLMSDVVNLIDRHDQSGPSASAGD
jgi:hypothetical protein